MKAFRELDAETKMALKGKIVIDTSNPYPERDGAIAEEARRDPGGTGSFVARLLPDARIVRAFNTVYSEDLKKTINKDGETIGIPIAGDDEDGVKAAVELAEHAGLDPVVVGGLSKSKMFDVGAAAEEVKNLKGAGRADIQVHGSGNLIQTLLKHNLVDELWLKIFPITLGSGKRLFAEGTIPVGFKLLESKSAPGGAIIASMCAQER
jgi:hypothetical protein